MLNYTDTVIFKNEKRIDALFTRKNTVSVNNEGHIPGLNLGMNTIADEAEIHSNYFTLLEDLKIDPNSVARAKQVHGSNIIEVFNGGVYKDCDALITAKPGLTLAIQVADCMALLIGDSDKGVIGAVHAGWRGAVDGIVPKTVNTLVKSFGASPDKLKIYVGPSICCDHFEVGEDVAERFPDRFVDRKSYRKPHIDLKSFVINQLIDQGIIEENIYPDPNCTWEESDLYYSYRREGNQSGRMLGIITMNF